MVIVARRSRTEKGTLTRRPLLILSVIALCALTACNDVIYRADDKVSGSNFTNDDANVAELQRRVAAGDEEARYDLAEYYISNGRYEEAEALGVLIECEKRRDCPNQAADQQ